MSLKDYFESHDGLGVLATADNEGKVDVAVYARPHFINGDDNEVAFIMNDHLSHANLQTNPQAAYLFREEGGGYDGKRLYLSKLREQTDPELIAAFRRRCTAEECDEENAKKKQFLVHFRVERVRPLIGDDCSNKACCAGG
jgi:hypothetical protein